LRPDFEKRWLKRREKVLWERKGTHIFLPVNLKAMNPRGRQCSKGKSKGGKKKETVNLRPKELLGGKKRKSSLPLTRKKKKNGISLSTSTKKHRGKVGALSYFFQGEGEKKRRKGKRKTDPTKGAIRFISIGREKGEREKAPSLFYGKKG